MAKKIFQESYLQKSSIFKKGTISNLISSFLINFEITALTLLAISSLFYYYIHPIVGFLFIPFIIISLLICYGLEDHSED